MPDHARLARFAARTRAFAAAVAASEAIDRCPAAHSQNKRFDAKTKGTPEDKRRRKHRTLLAKLRRVEARIERDQLTLVQVREELKTATTG